MKNNAVFTVLLRYIYNYNYNSDKMYEYVEPSFFSKQIE